MDAVPGRDFTKALEDAHRQIDHARVNVSHADTKASLLAAGTIPLAALLLAAPSLADHNGFVRAVAWTAASFIVMGIGFLGTVVWPRLSGSSGIRIAAHRSPDQIMRRLLEDSADPERRLRAATGEASLLATLAFEKFRRLRAAMACFAIAAVLMLAAAVGLAVSG